MLGQVEFFFLVISDHLWLKISLNLVPESSQSKLIIIKLFLKRLQRLLRLVFRHIMDHLWNHRRCIRDCFCIVAPLGRSLAVSEARRSIIVSLRMTSNLRLFQSILDETQLVHLCLNARLLSVDLVLDSVNVVFLPLFFVLKGLQDLKFGFDQSLQVFDLFLFLELVVNHFLDVPGVMHWHIDHLLSHIIHFNIFFRFLGKLFLMLQHEFGLGEDSVDVSVVHSLEAHRTILAFIFHVI